MPVLVSGGRPLRAENSEAAVMAGILKNEFGIAVRWREEQSQDTAGRSVTRRKSCARPGITRVVLVTQAFHMPRARLLFEGGRAAGGAGAGSFRQQDGGGFAASESAARRVGAAPFLLRLARTAGIAWARRLSGVDALAARLGEAKEA